MTVVPTKTGESDSVKFSRFGGTGELLELLKLLELESTLALELKLDKLELKLELLEFSDELLALELITALGLLCTMVRLLEITDELLGITLATLELLT